jgi:mannitol operon repressor
MVIVGNRSQAARDWRRLTEEFATESDRAAALVAAALLDANLEQLLRMFLVADEAEAELLLGSNLQSLGARVRAAYLLGLVSEDEMTDLRTIKEIRNHFAHNLHVSFADAWMERACGEFRLVRRAFSNAAQMSHRQMFEQATCMLSTLLVMRRRELATQRLRKRPEMTELEMNEQCPLMSHGGQGAGSGALPPSEEEPHA